MCLYRNKRSTLPALLFILSLATLKISAQGSYPPSIPEAKTEIYKTIGDIELKAWIFSPPKLKEGDGRPAILFFFGGGWTQGTPAQFTEHCKYLAARGMVAMTMDYRVAARHNVKAKTCVADAKSAVRWVRKNAARLGIDPDRIVAGGGSAGGHLAAATATLPALDEATDDLSISARPNALALFNPALVLASVSDKFSLDEKRQQSLEARAGVGLTNISPYHHINEEVAPTIIFHGTGDKTVPFETASLFQQRMSEVGRPCTLVGYKDAPHGFFNYGRNNNGPFIDTMNKLDAFLVSLGYLPPPPATAISQ